MINEIIGQVLMVAGLVFITIGIIGIYKYENFFTRAAIASVIDTAGFILIALGIIVYKGLNIFSLKVGVIICFILILNPLSNHVMVRGAYTSGYDPTKDRCKVKNTK